MSETIIQLPKQAIDITGETYCRLTAIAPVGKDKNNGILWLCLCVCGTEVKLPTVRLKSGNTKSCGCRQRDAVRKTGYANATHGMKKTPEWRAWSGMRTRCNNPNVANYSDYGGRGIRVHPEWDESFEEFYAYIGPSPGDGYSVDRYPNNDGNYEPGNVRWATGREQANNRRNTIYVEYGGETRTLAQWSRATGIAYHTLHGRIKNGWAVERALTEPPRRR